MTQTKLEKIEAHVNKINNWLVCHPIASAEDMYQSFPDMQEVAEQALTLIAEMKQPVGNEFDVEGLKADAVNFVFDSYFSARQQGKTHAKQRIEKLIDHLHKRGLIRGTVPQCQMSKRCKAYLDHAIGLLEESEADDRDHINGLNMLYTLKANLTDDTVPHIEGLEFDAVFSALEAVDEAGQTAGEPLDDMVNRSKIFIKAYAAMMKGE